MSFNHVLMLLSYRSHEYKLKLRDEVLTLRREMNLSYFSLDKTCVVSFRNAGCNSELLSNSVPFRLEAVTYVIIVR